MTTTPQAMMELIQRIETMDRKVRNVIDNQSGLSASGAATAIAMIVTLDFGVLREASTALRARAQVPA